MVTGPPLPTLFLGRRGMEVEAGVCTARERGGWTGGEGGEGWRGRRGASACVPEQYGSSLEKNGFCWPVEIPALSLAPVGSWACRLISQCPSFLLCKMGSQ